MEDDKKALGGCVLALSAIPVSLYLTWATGYVAERLWAWFVVTELHAPPISWRVWMALAMIVSLLVTRHRSRKKQGEQDDESPSEVFGWIIAAAITPWITLGFAWVLR